MQTIEQLAHIQLLNTKLILAFIQIFFELLDWPDARNLISLHDPPTCKKTESC